MNVFVNLEHAIHVPWVVISASFAAILILFAGMRVRSMVGASFRGAILAGT